MKRTFTVTVETDDANIVEKYHNYRFNWNSPEEFITYLAESWVEDCFDDFGYRVSVKPKAPT